VLSILPRRYSAFASRLRRFRPDSVSAIQIDTHGLSPFATDAHFSPPGEPEEMSDLERGHSEAPASRSLDIGALPRPTNDEIEPESASQRTQAPYPKP
jgi:hypothetical protein